MVALNKRGYPTGRTDDTPAEEIQRLWEFPVLNALEVAQILRINRQGVYKLLKTKQLRGREIHAGSKRPAWRVLREDLQSFLRGGAPEAAKPKPRRQKATKNHFDD